MAAWTRARGTLAAACVGAALAGCAAAPALPPEPPPGAEGPAPFAGLAALVLVREAGETASRPRDPLDAVRDALEAGGRRARVVEVGGEAAPDHAGLARLHGEVRTRILADGGSPDVSGAVLGRIEPPRALLAGLGADAAVLLVRFTPALPSDLLPEPGFDPFGARGLRPPRPPTGALALVDRDGHLAWFGWGGDPLGGAGFGPVTPAEAVDALLRVVEGDDGEG